MVRNIMENEKALIPAERLVDKCLDKLGAIEVTSDTRNLLVKFATENQLPEAGSVESQKESEQKVSNMLRLVASVPEFQRT